MADHHHHHNLPHQPHHPRPPHPLPPHHHAQYHHQHGMTPQSGIAHLPPSGRRASAAAASSSSPSIPPAPPLPPPPHSTARTALARIVQPFTAYGSRPPSAQAHRADVARSNPLVGRLPGVSALASQDTSHKTGLDITALDINQERSHAILAGREILKTVRIDGTRCSEDQNIRAAIKSYASHAAAASGHPAKLRETLDIHDVQWSHGAYSSFVATAATSGKVVLYDLHRAGVEQARLHEHHRQVHRIAFNPHQGYLLLSGSQDSTVRLWDLRDLRREAMACPSRERFRGQSEGVRDVKWSPTDGVEFAFGTDNGVIQRWDYRNPRGPKLKINAHDRICTCIDWHPDGKHVLSASTDRTAKVWDFSTDRRRQKPLWVISAPHPIFKARWRPPVWSSDGSGQGAWHTTQLVTSYDRDHPVVNIWDFRRPYLPFREIVRYGSAPTDLLWHSRDLLWTVGREGIFTQIDVHFSPKVMDRRNMQAFAMAPGGEISGVSQKRRTRRRATRDRTPEEPFSGDGREKRDSPEKASLGRSSADDSVDDSFLGSSHARHHGRTASNRSTMSFGSTPPSAEESKNVLMLGQILEKQKGSNQPAQVAFRGVLPVSFNVQIFTYLAQKYKAMPPADAITADYLQNIQRVFEQNAEYAQRAAFHRVAQSWKLVGFALSKILVQRAEASRRRRLDPDAEPSPGYRPFSPPGAVIPHHRKEPSQPINPAVRAIQDSLSSPHAGSPSSSNTATPLARPTSVATAIPIAGVGKAAGTNGSHTPIDSDHVEALALPDSLINISPKQNTSHPSHSSPESSRSTVDSARWYGSSLSFNGDRSATSDWRPHARVPLNLDPTHSPSPTNIPRMDRHNSDESFAFFPASVESQQGMSMASSFASGRSRLEQHLPRSDESESPEESNFSRSAPRSSASLKQDSADGGRLGPRPNRSMSGSSRLPGLLEESDQNLPLDGSMDFSSLAAPRTAPLQLTALAESTQSVDSLRTSDFLRRSMSSESEAVTSTKESFESSSLYNSENMEASGTIVPDADNTRPPIPRHGIDNASKALEGKVEPEVLDESFRVSDFLPSSSDKASPGPIRFADMLNQLLTFHATTLSDAQTASHFLLLCKSLLPPTAPLPSGTASQLLDHYAATLTNTLPPSVAHQPSAAPPTNTHLHLLRAGVNPLFAESILTTYHAHLLALGLFNAAACLRRHASPTFPAVTEQSTRDTQVAAMCRACRGPLPAPRARCDTCRRPPEPCPVCWSRDSPLDGAGAFVTAAAAGGGGRGHHKRKVAKAARAASGGVLPAALDPPNGKPPRRNRLVVPTTSVDATITLAPPPSPSPLTPPAPQLWSWCPLCGHGGHATCLSTWYGDTATVAASSTSASNPAPAAAAAARAPLGACATPGCRCDCVRGAWREERLRGLRGRWAERERSRVRDAWVVGESRAVAGARGRLRGEGSGVGEEETEKGAGVGLGLGLPVQGASGGRKRVRVMEPGDGRRG